MMTYLLRIGFFNARRISAITDLRNCSLNVEDP